MERTKEQQQAIETSARTVCVDAGAGSGKTRVLIERIVYLIEQRLAGLDDIVAITFTENAAAEMKARLRAAFRARAPQRDPGQMSFWRDLERRVDSARIATIHSFCSSILRENAIAIGLDPEFEVLADADAALLLTRTVAQAVRDLVEQEDESLLRLAADLNLNDLRDLLRTFLNRRATLEQLASTGVLDDAAALRKDWARVLRTERNRRLLALRYHPAVQGLSRRLERFSGQCLKPNDGRELRRQAYLDTLGTILTAKDSASIAAAIESAAGFTAARSSAKNWPSEVVFKQLTKCQNDVKDFLQDYLPRVPDEIIERRAAEQTTALYAVFQHVAAVYARAKSARNGLDFDDLLLRTLDALKADADLRARAARGIRYLFIDEFQDTDHVQLEIAHLLSGESGGPNLFIVGDAKQSIYLFRGAEVGVFAEQRDSSEEVIPLDRNFRTVPDVLAMINEFFARSRTLAAVQEPYAPMTAHRAACSQPRVEFLIPPETDGWFTDDYRRAEADMIAARILELCDANNGLLIEQELNSRRARFRDVALLLREMNHAYLYEEALSRAGIPYMVVSGKGFYEQQEVIDVLNLLEVLLDPWNEQALLAFLRSPIIGLSDDDLVRCRGRRGLAAAFNGVDEPPFASEIGTWRRAHTMVCGLRERLIRPLPELLRTILDETGLEAILLSQYLGLQRVANVRKLVDLAGAFSRLQPPTLRAFIDYVNSVRDEAVREGQAIMQPEGNGAVALMTVHKAKGLEFPIVVIPGAAQARNSGASRPAALLHRDLGFVLKTTGEDGERTVPEMAAAISARHEEEQYAEHARLLYVALTRAREALVISGAPKAGSGSWLSWLDAEFDLLAAADGGLIEGNGWRATVRRASAAPLPASRALAPAAAVSIEAVQRMIGPAVASTDTRRTVSISALLDALFGKTEFASAKKRTPDRIDPAVRGTLVHRMFEQWKFDGSWEPDFERLVRGAGIAVRERAATVETLKETADRFRVSELAGAMARASVLRREIPFSLRIADALVNGKIDALLGEDTIIDYKTGQMREETNARYEFQILLYAAAVRALTGTTPCRGLLWYADAGCEHEVDVSPARIDDALNRAAEALPSLPPVCDEEIASIDL